MKETFPVSCHYPINLDQDVYIVNVRIYNVRNEQTDHYTYQVVGDKNPSVVLKRFKANGNITPEFYSFLKENLSSIYVDEEIKNAEVDVMKLEHILGIDID